MKVLHLKLKKEWFDMIASGEKKEEYRDIKPFWWTRLVHIGAFSYLDPVVTQFKQYDAIHFMNGYSRKAPQLLIECKGILLAEGKHEWGASGRKQFTIKLGEILPLAS
jgi:hypothetical protein